MTVGPAEPKHKPSAIGDYSSSTLKRVKPDQNGLRNLNVYGASSAPHPHYHPQQYRQSNNGDMMQTFFQQYGASNAPTPKGPYSNAQPSYWTGSREDPAAMWQQQHYH